jgi:hypothetical protein
LALAATAQVDPLALAATAQVDLMTSFRTERRGVQVAGIIAGILLWLLPTMGNAQAPASDGPGVAPQPSQGASAATLHTLGSFVDLRKSLLREIEEANRELATAETDAEKKDLQSQLDKLDSDLRAVTANFENIAAGVDITSLRAEAAGEFNFQREVLALLKPALDEMREMTAHVRQKSDLKEKIASYDERLPVLEKALTNVQRLMAKSKDPAIVEALQVTADNWQRQQAFMQSELQAARLQLEKLVASEVSLAQASESYLKSFFQARGLYLTEALLVVVGIVLLSRLSHKALVRYMPGFRKTHRSFRIRLVDLLHRIITVFLVVIGPMIVFYLVEDWVLFSLSILLLLGIAWTLRQALPRYIHQIQIFLNIGSVREGERLLLDGLPWQVRTINVFSTLVNPVAELTQRVPLENLVGLKSRPSRHDEPWFPCKKGDWVILSDGVRGKVVGISPELVQLVERGGAQCTYQTGDFLAKSPRNLATNFRLKETLGISYKLQKESTAGIPETLQGYIQRRAEQEGYGDQLLNLRVEFAMANSSSLDLVVIADFDGALGDLYNRLRRAIQRWCVDACTEYGWEIPFPQMTLHGAVARGD